MACMRLGSKSDAFHIDGTIWTCSTGLPSDVTVEVEDVSFHLHKFPLLSRSEVLADLISRSSSKDEQNCILQLHDIPGGAKAFLLVAKFCYSVKIELTALNVVSLRCAAEYLQMTEEFGEENLISQTEHFLEEIFSSWTDSLKALETCEEVLPLAEDLHIVSRCINSLAMKACTDPSLFSWPVACEASKDGLSPVGGTVWNGIRATSNSKTMNPVGEDWWYEDVSNFLRLSLYKRLILAVGARGMKAERIAGSIMHYTKRHLPLMGREPGFQNPTNSSSTVSSVSESDQKNLLEEIVNLLPDQNGVTPTKFLLRLLRTSMFLNVAPACRDKLEKRVGAQLDQAVLEDILIPNMGYSMETLYDIDCVQRLLDHFMIADQDEVNPISGFVEEEGQLMGTSHSLTPMTMVASLVDGYLAEVATDVNLKLTKFQALAAVVPDYARAMDDGIYRAIDIYLKAHPWLTDLEREQLCRLMNCQKLSMEACTHAAQNERLPLRVIVQVLFFEQLRLRTSIAGWFFVSDNLDNSQNLSGNLALARTHHNQVQSSGQNAATLDDMKERVLELEKECMNMKQELHKLVKTKGTWNIFFRRFPFRLRSKATNDQPKGSVKQSCDAKETIESSVKEIPENNGSSWLELPVSVQPVNDEYYSFDEFEETSGFPDDASQMFRSVFGACFDDE